MSQLPTIKQLRYFVALEKHLHFGRAADACFVSQSAFSVAIKELENLLELQLVDRTNKQVTMNDTGREFARGARQILEELENLVEVTGSKKSPLSSKLKLGVIPTIAPFIVPQILPELRHQYPELKLYLTEDLTHRLYEKLMQGDVDVVLLALPYSMRGVESQVLFRDRFYLAHRENSQWLEAGETNLQQLPDDSILLLEDGHCLRDHAIDACHLKNQESVARFSASSLFTLIQMVDEDLGVTYLPEMAIDTPILAHTQIHTTALAADSFREIGLVWRQGSARREDFERLGELIRAQSGG